MNLWMGSKRSAIFKLVTAVFTADNLKWRPNKSTVSGRRSGQTERNTSACGFKAKPKDKVPSITLTVMFSWAISTMTKQMVKASMFTETAKFTKDSGSMICNMATVGKKCQMEVHLKGNSQEVARMVMDFIDGLIRRCTRVSGSRVR